MITIQYLEDAPDLPQRKTAVVVEKLRAAADALPFTHLLIGWHLPPHLLEACRKEAEHLGWRFLRWHPLLTGDHVFQSRPDWQVVGANGCKIQGFRGMVEFTFVCPNHPGVQEAISRRLETLLSEGVYDGFLLDRIRFPSPAGNPESELGCFCTHCHSKAASIGLDLEQVQRDLTDMAGSAQGKLSLVWAILNGSVHHLPHGTAETLLEFLKFRCRSVTELVAMQSRLLRQAGMETGLDCFSPSLTGMVGQDLLALSKSADWIKVMSYAHSLGPAGIPFELLALFDYLSTTTDRKQSQIMTWLQDALGIPLPATRSALAKEGLCSTSLKAELQRSTGSLSIPLLAGIELVQIKGVAELNATQIQADLEAIQSSGVSGLSISWDLWDIPLDHLEMVNRVVNG